MTYGEVLPIWWSVTWRTIVASSIAGFIAGFMVGFIGALLGYPELANHWGALAGFLASFPASLWAVRAAINKRGFRPSPDAL